MINHNDYINSGFRIFNLHGVTDGVCDCGNDKCKALYKHPKMGSWQHTPKEWSPIQINAMETYGGIDTGFGVLVDNHIIIDIDPRNGGNEGYKKLCDDTGIDFKKESGFVVKTGGGGWHIYFSRPKDSALVSHLKEYQGIDFKSSGYVVGCSSLHASGNRYEIEKGIPACIDEPPKELLLLLKKENKKRTEYKGQHVDLSDKDLSEMLDCCDPNCEYETWIKIGMALHEASSGTALDLWDCWSSNSDKYPKLEQVEKHWHSFGKSANPVGVGTLFFYAEQGGYKPSVTFETDLVFTDSTEDSSEIDILRPQGFLGEITKWINDQCRYPREHLAVATALATIGNIAGLRYEDQEYGVTTNQFIFCVAASATGKEAVQQAQAELQRAVGFAPATHGAIKSEQEIVRNLIDHQSALYIIDEMGLMLQKVANARARGGAAYLEGVIGMLMSAYSKANSLLLLSGDVRKEVKEGLKRELAGLNKKADMGDNVDHAISTLEKQLNSIDSGLERPFLSLIGYTTPVTFNSLVDYEQAANGFFGRSIIVQEKETNPKIKKGFKKRELDSHLKMALNRIAWNGHGQPLNRIEQLGDRVKIPTESDAIEYLEIVGDKYHAMAEKHKEDTLEAIPRRAFELVLKVSLILAIPEGVRALQHVKWAEAYIDHDIKQKINLTASNMAETDNRHDEALARKIINMLDKKTGEKTGVIANRCRQYKKEDIITTLERLEEKKAIKSETGSRNSKTWRLT